jgi:hypothetical protein
LGPDSTVGGEIIEIASDPRLILGLEAALKILCGGMVTDKSFPGRELREYWPWAGCEKANYGVFGFSIGRIQGRFGTPESH